MSCHLKAYRPRLRPELCLLLLRPVAPSEYSKMGNWWAAGLAVPAVVASGLLGRNKGDKQTQQPQQQLAERQETSDPNFVCERVCTSDSLLRRMGGLSKDPTPNTCVTVCGTSTHDACVDACQRAVCANMHQVPAWNDACLKRSPQADTSLVNRPPNNDGQAENNFGWLLFAEVAQ
ncbi:hypothetical protein WJX84_004268 [Apatococcus fuscideae]|uniref:Uncharacterized protein n=1 Tax=Apatococcus fuscideae TaxID=2026836 RepID=A0AAW1TCK7_9CHLO